MVNIASGFGNPETEGAARRASFSGIGGGAAQGLLSFFGERQKQDVESQKQLAAAVEALQQRRQQLTDTLVQAKSQFPGTAEEFDSKFGAQIQQLEQTFSQMFGEEGAIAQQFSEQGVGVSPGAFLGLQQPPLGLMDRLSLVPTAIETARGEGRGTGEQRLAEAAALEAGGIPSTQALATAGVAVPDIPKVQTEIGKLLEDQQIVSERFGEGSPQAEAINEVIRSKSSGEAPSISDISGLRREFTKASGSFIKNRAAFERIRFAAENSTPAGDLALIFGFMKLQDEGSTVREGEFATAENSGNVSDEVIGLYNRVWAGTRLSERQRNDFLFQAKGLFSGSLRRQVEREAEFSRIAEEGRFPVGQVILDFKGDIRDDLSLLTEDQEPMAGEVEDFDTEILAKDDITDEDLGRLSPAGLETLKQRIQKRMQGETGTRTRGSLVRGNPSGN